jgi:hypothetical protein
VNSRLSERVKYELTKDFATARCSLGHIDERLGDLLQYFERNTSQYDTLADGRACWESSFVIFSRASAKYINTRDLGLSREQRDQIWDELFQLKNTLLREVQPDILIHRVKPPFPYERRLALYRERINWTGYSFIHYSNFITLERK